MGVNAYSILSSAQNPNKLSHLFGKFWGAMVLGGEDGTGEGTHVRSPVGPEAPEGEFRAPMGVLGAEKVDV